MHNVFTEQVNKIALSFNDKRLKSFNKVKCYAHELSVGKGWRKESRNWNHIITSYIQSKKRHS